MATQMYNARVELKTPRTRAADAEISDDLVDKLAAYHAAVGPSVRGWLEAIISLPAESLSQASSTAIAVVSQSAGAEAIACEVMTEAEFDAREGWVPIPDLVSVVEAAEILGVTRQAVADRIRRGTLQATRVGRDYAIPRGQLQTASTLEAAEK